MVMITFGNEFLNFHPHLVNDPKSHFKYTWKFTYDFFSILSTHGPPSMPWMPCPATTEPTPHPPMAHGTALLPCGSFWSVCALAYTKAQSLVDLWVCGGKTYWCVLRREWMGCWGLLGWLLLVMTGIIPENSLRLAPVSRTIKYSWSLKNNIQLELYIVFLALKKLTGGFLTW